MRWKAAMTAVWTVIAVCLTILFYEVCVFAF